MLLNSHPSDVAILHCQPLLTLDDHVELTALFDTQLQNLEGILNKIVFDVVIDAGVSSETRHVVHLEHPGL